MSSLPKPTIQAFDEPDGTIYVLARPGKPLVSAPWPQPLYELEPNAVRLPSHDSDVIPMPDVGQVVVYQPESFKLSPGARELLRVLRLRWIRCEDCRHRIKEGDLVVLDLFRKTPGSSGKRVWDATKGKWARRPAQGPRKRARRDGYRFRQVNLCSRCATIEKAKVRKWGKDPALPKRGGRPPLLTEQQLRQAYLIYESTGLSQLEIARRLHASLGKGTLSGYTQSLLYGWRKLHLPLRDRGEQIAISRFGTDGTKAKHWRVRCKQRLRNGSRCQQWVRREVTEKSAKPADDGLCFTHAHLTKRRTR